MDLLGPGLVGGAKIGPCGPRGREGQGEFVKQDARGGEMEGGEVEHEKPEGARGGEMEHGKPEGVRGAVEYEKPEDARGAEALDEAQKAAHGVGEL